MITVGRILKFHIWQLYLSTWGTFDLLGCRQIIQYPLNYHEAEVHTLSTLLRPMTQGL